LEQSGVNLHHIGSGKESAADIGILGEIMKLIFFTKPPHAIYLISGDRDFSKILHFLDSLHYDLTLIHNPQVSQTLVHSVNKSVLWKDLFSSAARTTDSHWAVSTQPTLNRPKTLCTDFAPLVVYLKSQKNFQCLMSRMGLETKTLYTAMGYTSLRSFIDAAVKAGVVSILQDPSSPVVQLNQTDDPLESCQPATVVELSVPNPDESKALVRQRDDRGARPVSVWSQLADHETLVLTSVVSKPSPEPSEPNLLEIGSRSSITLDEFDVYLVARKNSKEPSIPNKAKKILGLVGDDAISLASEQGSINTLAAPRKSFASQTSRRFSLSVKPFHKRRMPKVDGACSVM
ncbi:hypothetical protein HDU91_002859, partial [Kappamyces sp. JEL0680]